MSCAGVRAVRTRGGLDAGLRTTGVRRNWTKGKRAGHCGQDREIAGSTTRYPGNVNAPRRVRFRHMTMVSHRPTPAGQWKRPDCCMTREASEARKEYLKKGGRVEHCFGCLGGRCAGGLPVVAHECLQCPSIQKTCEIDEEAPRTHGAI